MIKTLLFDNNGVITTDNEEQDLADLFSVNLEDFKQPHKEIHPEYALGNISVEEYCDRHREAFNSDHDLEIIKKAHYNSYLLIPGMKELLHSLKGEFEIAMLTNFGVGFDEANAVWGLEDVFESEKIFVSSKIGFLKPDKESYLHVLQKLKRKPAEVIFIDDRIKNVEAAEQVGIRGIVFNDANQFRNELNRILEEEKNKND